MLLRKLKYYGYRVAPGPAAVLHGWLRRFMRHPARAKRGRSDVLSSTSDLVLRASGLPGVQGDLPQLVDLALSHPAITTNQNRAEILGLLELLRRRPPRVLCEIGSAGGGTLFLFSRIADPRARLLSIDLLNSAERRERFSRLVLPDQRLECLEGDSHATATLERFSAWLGSDRLDFLFVDGDHTRDGVERDFEMYGRFVAPDGIVAFHDIVADFGSRYGRSTGAWAGGVPEYWSALKEKRRPLAELIEHPLQDGRGIGVVGGTEPL